MVISHVRTVFYVQVCAASVTSTAHINKYNKKRTFSLSFASVIVVLFYQFRDYGSLFYAKPRAWAREITSFKLPWSQNWI
jgi:hypothetical protein